MTLQVRCAAALLVFAAALLGSAPMAKALVLFSPVDGVVTRDGVPVAGAKVVRSFDWAWGNEKGSDSTVTDKDGHYAFPAITRKSLSASLVPHQPSIAETIDIEVDGKTYEGWYLQKLDYDMNGELSGRDIRLACDLATPAVRRETHYGLCTLR